MALCTYAIGANASANEDVKLHAPYPACLFAESLIGRRNLGLRGEDGEGKMFAISIIYPATFPSSILTDAYLYHTTFRNIHRCDYFLQITKMTELMQVGFRDGTIINPRQNERGGKKGA